jgi:hypothetical protein
MALLFSAVRVTAGDEETELLVGGIPREYDDLEGWTRFDHFVENLDKTTEVSVHTDGIMKKYRPNLPPPEDEKKTTGKKDTGKQSSKEQPRPKPSKGGTEMRPVPPSRRTPLNTQGGMSHEPT